MPNDQEPGALEDHASALRAASVRASLCPLLSACSTAVRSDRVARCVESFRAGSRDDTSSHGIVRDTLDNRCSLREGFAAVAAMEARRAVAAAAAGDEAGVIRHARLAASAAIDAADLTADASQVRAVAEAVLASLAPA